MNAHVAVVTAPSGKGDRTNSAARRRKRRQAEHKRREAER